MYKLCVFAGTTEGRELIGLLAGQPVAVTACVATEYGESLLSPRAGLSVSAGRLTEPEMAKRFHQEKYDLVIDATHPYAAEVTENIANACRETETAYLRLLRGAEDAPEDAVLVPDIPSAVEFLRGTEGNILLTTGSKELGKYAVLPRFAERVYARVLPMEASLAACRDAGLGPARIWAMQGPFSRELNAAMLRSVSAKYMVTKDTGGTGGFAGKAAAARDAGAVLVVVGRPAQREGLDFAGTVDFLAERFHLCFRPKVSLAGIGPGGTDGMTVEAAKALAEADCVIGAARMLDAVAKPGQARLEAIAPETIAPYIREARACRRFAVALSGDTGFFSGAKRLLPLLADCEVEILPGISSMQALCAGLGTSYEDVVPVSLHGRSRDIVPDVWQNRRVFALVGGENGAANLCRVLADAGLGEISVSIGERLGYPEARITQGSAQELAGRSFDALSAALIENPLARPFTPGLPDEWFQRGQGEGGRMVPMTKRETRACAMSLLGLTRDAICWDVGAGTGSISVEMALQAREGTVYAIEKNAAALALLEENRAKFHTSNLEIIPGDAPAACEMLSAPTHVFLGGSSGRLRGIIDLLLEKNPGVRIAAAAVTLESAAELTALMKDPRFAECSVVCLTAARGREAGAYHLMMGQNPVYLFLFQGRRGG